MRTSSRRCAPLRFPIVVPHLTYTSVVSKAACGSGLSDCLWYIGEPSHVCAASWLAPEPFEHSGERE